jgi:hypothetical protein
VIQGVWRQGSDGAWYVACAHSGLEHVEVQVRHNDGSPRIVTVIGEMKNEEPQFERETLFLYDFERGDDFVDG